MYIAEHAQEFVERLSLRKPAGEAQFIRRGAGADLEELLTTASGFAVGYLDVVIRSTGLWSCVQQFSSSCEAEFGRDKCCKNLELRNGRLENAWFNVSEHSHRVERTTYDRTAIEVKVHFPGVGEVLRQINLYRAHFRADHWVLATPQTLRNVDIRALNDADIQYIRVGGERFDAWMAEQVVYP